ncbi:MAG: polyphosphate kinase 1, partial [Sediminibacterium sp.]
LNEKTARIYADHCLLTASRSLLLEVNKVFTYLETWQLGDKPIGKTRNLLISPINMRNSIVQLIENEIKHAKQGKVAKITIKSNSISDHMLVDLLYKAVKAGVEVNLIIRGILTLKKGTEKINHKIKAISIVDQYLEHARVMIFHNNKNEKVYISSADWMVRNLDHRIEVATPILDIKLKNELIDIINIQLKDNQKARILEENLGNNYVSSLGKKHCKSQVDTYKYLIGKK